MRGLVRPGTVVTSALAVMLIALAFSSSLSWARNAQGSPTADASPDAAFATAQSLQVPLGCVTEAMDTEDSSPVSSPVTTSPLPMSSVQVTLVDLSFQPCALEFPADTLVTITLTNDGTAVGNFIVDELGVRSDEIEAGETTEITITAPAGTYAFYSDVPGQRQAGRAGILVVGDGGKAVLGTPQPGTPAT